MNRLSETDVQQAISALGLKMEERERRLEDLRASLEQDVAAHDRAMSDAILRYADGEADIDIKLLALKREAARQVLSTMDARIAEVRQRGDSERKALQRQQEFANGMMSDLQTYRSKALAIQFGEPSKDAVDQYLKYAWSAFGRPELDRAVQVLSEAGHREVALERLRMLVALKVIDLPEAEWAA